MWTSCRSAIRSRASSRPPTRRRPQNVRRRPMGPREKPNGFRFCSLPASIAVLFVKNLCFFFLSSGVRDTVIVEERSDGETSEAEPEETEPDRDATATATAAASNSDGEPAAPGSCLRSRGNDRGPGLAVPLPQSAKRRELD